MISKTKYNPHVTRVPFSIKGLLRFIVIFLLFISYSYEIVGQCIIGYKQQTISGYASAIYFQNLVDFSGNAIGIQDNDGAELFQNGDYFDLDLGYTILAGEQYTIRWKQRPGEGGFSTMTLFESDNGSAWTEHPRSSGGSATITTTNEASFEDIIITANINTRYLRIRKIIAPDFLIDAITFTASVCLPDPSCAPISVENITAGNAVSLVSQTSIVDPTFALGIPDQNGARLDDAGDVLVLRLNDTIPAGQKYQVIWKRRNGTFTTAHLYFDESLNGSAFTEHSQSGNYTTDDQIYYIITSITAESDTYYLRFRNPSGAFGDFWIDAVVFNAVECIPTASITPYPANTCVGTGLNLNGNPSGGSGSYTTHLWTGDTGPLSSTNIQNPTFSTTIPNSYNLTYTVTDSKGHTATDNIVVLVNSVPVVTLGYSYQKTITINAAQVSGGVDLIDFPMLVSFTDPDLRTTGNGGKLQSANGYDVAFTDAAGNPLKFEINQYNPGSGLYTAWVRVPVLSYSSNTDITMLYGKTGIISNSSSTDTWSSDFVQVMHLDGDFQDATQFGNSGTNSGTSGTGGKILSGRSFDGVNDKITVPDSPSLDGTNDEATFSLWINWNNSADGGYQRIMVSSNRVGPPNNGYEWASQPTGNHFFYPKVDDAYNNYNLGPNPFTNGIWQHLAVTLKYSTKSVKIYVNGVPMVFGTLNVPSFWTSLADIDDWIWGGEPNNFAGSMDEIRVQTIERTEDWLLTEFRNQNNPASFYSVSAESVHNLLPDELCSNDTPVTLNQARPLGGTYSGPGVSGGVFTPSTAGAGNHTIIYSYTDMNGCAGTGSEIITVHPIPSPVVTGPIEVCPGAVGVHYSTPDIAGHTYIWTITGASFYSGEDTDEIIVTWPGGSCNTSGTISLSETITATGCSTVTSDYVVTILDNTAPTFTQPADITIYKDASCNYNAAIGITGDVTDEADNCDTSLDATFTDAVVAGGCEGEQIITRTWSLTDDCGNTTTHDQIITVEDNIAPTFTQPADITIYTTATCTYDASVSATGDVTNEADNCATDLEATFTDMIVAGACEGTHIITRTWHLIDNCGNAAADQVQTITVSDSTSPTFTVPNDIIICRSTDCTFDKSVGVTGDVTDEADNCSTGIIATFIDDETGLISCDETGFILRTWTLIDNCGNSTIKVQTIWVEPTPKATIVNNTPIICDSSNVNLVFDSPTITSNPANLNFEVVVTSTDPANLTGTASSDFMINKIQMPYTLNGTLINNSDAPIQVTYTVNSLLAGCSEFIPVSETVWVNPTPRIFPVYPDTIQCDSSTTAILIQSPSTFTSGLVTFNFAAAATGGVTGFTPNATGLANGFLITDFLINPTNELQTVIYNVIPVSPTVCNNGPAQAITVYVNPTAQLSVSIPDTILCDSTTTTITVNDLNGPVHGSTTKVYQLTTTDAGGTVLGVQPGGEYLAGTDIVNTLINTTNQIQAITYH
ncbi:MAG TPA: DUF2341 domain-containing protein, partial [Bacteroidales bacterium]|nr:DUF2341 domain-containing protein [Bacteroidales bacterium]